MDKLTKAEAIAIFGSPRETAEALGVYVQAVYQWPDPLTDAIRDRVLGAAYRLGKIPCGDKTKHSA